MLGDYNMSQPKLYTDKIAGSISACMGFVRDGGEGRFVPNTVLEGDIRSKVKSAAVQGRCLVRRRFALFRARQKAPAAFLFSFIVLQ